MATLTLHPNVVLTARAGSPRSLNSLEKDCVNAILGRSSATTMQVRTQDRFTPFVCGRGRRDGPEPPEEALEGHPRGTRHRNRSRAMGRQTAHPGLLLPWVSLAGSRVPRVLSMIALDGPLSSAPAPGLLCPAPGPAPHGVLRASRGPTPHPGTPGSHTLLCRGGCAEEEGDRWGHREELAAGRGPG